MAKKGEWLNPEKQHTLTELECELITLFRMFSKANQQTLFKLMYLAAM